MDDRSTGSLVTKAWKQGIVVPAFNIPYLPMMSAVVEALRHTDCFGLIQVARLEWIKFQAGSLKAVRDEFLAVRDPRCTRLHLDHVPVIDEDHERVDYEAVIGEALELGYESVMVDGSRLSLDENIACTERVVRMAHGAGVPAEAELGAILGHESGPLPPYDELFASGKGFTDPEEAARFAAETGVDWLSVAIGNIHGAISGAAKGEKKIEARLSLDHLERIRRRVGRPLVLHGGTGIRRSDILDSFRHGIAKINVATAIRQPYEKAVQRSVADGQRAVYEATVELVRDELSIAGSATALLSDHPGKSRS